jgi:eukaryotic-like serine/threonine-protein kinase
MSALKPDVSPTDGAEASVTQRSDGGYPTTSWTIVRAAGSTQPARARVALLALAESYRGPVRAYLLSDGYTDAEAGALAERFFNELGSMSALRSAPRGSEPFRVWLIRALEQFLSSDPDPTRPPEAAAVPDSEGNGLPSIPGYECIEKLGVGAEGTVYRAYDLRAQRQVALKVLHPLHLREPEVIERFQKSIALASTLDHPNIVRVYDKGSPRDGHPYCAMQLVVGGTLAERQRQEQFREPASAARVVIKIARALHHAHQHGILHRDVSPANVLLDNNDEPFVSDFLAKRIRQSGPSTAVGKFAYAAPELAEGNGGTVEADVYGLGAILYELWTGKPPIRADSFDEVRKQHERGGPQPARSLVPTIPRDLDVVCRAALSRDPKERHASAAAFADSLERALARFPPLWPKVTRARRVWLWVSRHPLLAVGALLGTLVLLAADWLTLASVRAQQAELELATLHGNAALASAQARAVLSLFEKVGSDAARMAIEPEVREFLERDQIGSVSLLRKAIESTRSSDSAGIFSRDGRLLARYPETTPGLLGREFRFRAYYECVDALAKSPELGERRDQELEVCISPAYRGEASGKIEFTVAAPVYGRGIIGFVTLNKHAKNTLEEIEIDDVYQSGQTTALFGLRGRDRSSETSHGSSVEQLTAVAHPGLFSSEERALELGLSHKLLEHFAAPTAPGRQLSPLRVRPWEEASYVDPVTGDRRLAGFAPVGATGFVVAVSTPRARALGASERHIQGLWRYAAMLNLGFLLLGSVALWGSLRDIPPGSRR